MLYVYFFFFSSRRRHTRYWRDWSSDVCSSDLDRLGSGHGDLRVDSALRQVVQAGGELAPPGGTHLEHRRDLAVRRERPGERREAREEGLATRGEGRLLGGHRVEAVELGRRRHEPVVADRDEDALAQVRVEDALEPGASLCPVEAADLDARDAHARKDGVVQHHGADEREHADGRDEGRG